MKPTNGLPMRKWKVSIFAIDDMAEHCPLNYVERVEYILHPTFEPPERGNENIINNLRVYLTNQNNIT